MNPTSPRPEDSKPTPSPEATSAPTPLRVLTLVKGGESFQFRYESGQEQQVIESLVEFVNRRDVAFDWFDAAVLSHQLGQHLSKELQGFVPKKVA